MWAYGVLWYKHIPCGISATAEIMRDNVHVAREQIQSRYDGQSDGEIASERFNVPAVFFHVLPFLLGLPLFCGGLCAWVWVCVRALAFTLI